MEKIDEIMSLQHQFIYSNDTRKKYDLLKEVEQLYPIKYNEDSSMAVVLNSIGLPNIDEVTYDKDDKILKEIAKEYLDLKIVSNILSKIKKDLDNHTLDSIITSLLSFVNVNYLSEEYPKITSLDKLLEYLQYSQIYYLNKYQKHILGSTSIKENTIPIKPIDLDLFLHHTKRMLRNNGEFHVFAPLEYDINPMSARAINSIISTKYNRSIAMKVICEPNQWPTYQELGRYDIEYIHNYKIVELDKPKVLKKTKE